MKKNIAVIDAEGNVYEATWPRRARGLVKSGRARFVGRNTICLVRPPAYTEGKCMEQILDSKMTNSPQAEALQSDAAGKESEKRTAKAAEAGLDMSFVVRKINEITAGTAELRAAIGQMENLEDTAAEALGSMMEAREMTNQQMISLLQNILDAVKPDPALVRMEAVTKLLSDAGLDENHKFDLLNQTIQRLF